MSVRTFGPFRLDVDAGVLFRGTEPVALGRRAVALLSALVERPGALISKDTLIDAAWSGLAVEEGNLSVQISMLRTWPSEIDCRQSLPSVAPIWPRLLNSTPSLSTTSTCARCLIKPAVRLGTDLIDKCDWRQNEFSIRGQQ